MNGPNGIKVRQNTKNSPTCKFCLCSGHRIDHCPQRDQLKLDGSREFIVSDSFQNEDLRKRIENDMPIAVMSENTNCVSVVSRELSRRHFIIHEAYAKVQHQHYGYIPMNDMFFMVTFITKNGLIDSINQRLIISGMTINNLISSSAQLTSVKRFIYDQTSAPVPNQNWHARQSMKNLMQIDNNTGPTLV